MFQTQSACLGSGFFQEYTGVKRDKQLRTYDHTAFVMEEQADDPEGTAEAFWTTDDIDDETLEAMAAEDEDAALILQFEDAMADTIQNDSDLTAFYSTYQDARRRLSERVRVRGFWPSPQGREGQEQSLQRQGQGEESAWEFGTSNSQLILPSMLSEGALEG